MLLHHSEKSLPDQLAFLYDKIMAIWDSFVPFDSKLVHVLPRTQVLRVNFHPTLSFRET